MFLEIRVKMEIISIVIVEKLGKFCAVVNFGIFPPPLLCDTCIDKTKKILPPPPHQRFTLSLGWDRQLQQKKEFDFMRKVYVQGFENNKTDTKLL